VYGEAINDEGVIAGAGVPVGCQPADTNICGHAYVLIPDGDCDDDCEARIAASQNSAASAVLVRQATPAAIQENSAASNPAYRVRDLMRQRFHLPGQRPAPSD
jgi:hypothetical protein